MTQDIAQYDVWQDGSFVAGPDASFPLLTHALHYGLGVFEGVRAYQDDDGCSAVFRLNDHTMRLFRSAHILQIDIPWSVEQINQAIIDTMLRNQLADGYIRPISFLGAGSMGLYPKDNPVVTAIAAWPWGAYLGEEGLQNGIRLKTSSFSRHHINSAMTKAKATGFYVNSILAKREVVKAGYDEAMMLDSHGNVAECSGENIFLISRGRLLTPPLSGVLEGITRDTVIRIAAALGIEVAEAQITRDDVYCADEMFLCGTAAEITPVREVDDRTIGEGTRGPLTEQIQKYYFDLVHGRKVLEADWLARYQVEVPA